VRGTARARGPRTVAESGGATLEPVPELSVLAWTVSVLTVVVSAATAWLEGNWRRRPNLDLGFANHGGMWGDLILLPFVNAVIVPWIRPGSWLAGPLAVAVPVSLWLHARWHGGGGAREHMWPARSHGHWSRDLSVAGWLHVLYVIGQLTLLLAYAVTPVPTAVVLVVSAVLTMHVPLGLLQPARALTGRWSPRHPLLIPALVLIWGVAAVKLV
jgi:hypothetical protein